MRTPLLVPSQDVPHAPLNPVSARFWAGCQRGELRYQRCDSCGAVAFPATEACRRCLGVDLTWETSAGTGRLYSWTVVWRPATPAFPAPYAPAIIALAEGFQLVSNLIDATVEELFVDQPVVVAFRAVGELTLPYFTPERRDPPRR